MGRVARMQYTVQSWPARPGAVVGLPGTRGGSTCSRLPCLPPSRLASYFPNSQLAYGPRLGYVPGQRGAGSTQECLGQVTA